VGIAHCSSFEVRANPPPRGSSLPWSVVDNLIL
jgi:hypothetical protein